MGFHGAPPAFFSARQESFMAKRWCRDCPANNYARIVPKDRVIGVFRQLLEMSYLFKLSLFHDPGKTVEK
jgi:hypothetical protein